MIGLSIAAVLIAGLAFWLWCVIRVTKAGVRPLPPGDPEHLRGQAKDEPDTAAMWRVGARECDHGVSLTVECAECESGRYDLRGIH